MTASITRALTRSSRRMGIRIPRYEPPELLPDFLLGQLVEPVHQVDDFRQVVLADHAPPRQTFKGGKKAQLQAFHILKQAQRPSPPAPAPSHLVDVDEAGVLLDEPQIHRAGFALALLGEDNL